MDPTEGDIADGPGGQFLVFKYGSWHPSDANGRPLQPIDASSRWGSGARELPNGRVERVGPRGGVSEVSTGESGPGASLTGEQARALQYGIMMRGAEDDYQRARREGYNPGSARNQFARMAGAVPFDGDFFGRLIRDDASDAGVQAERRWAEANLRQLTGAAATNAEIARIAAINFDQGNDDLAQQRYRTRADTYRGTQWAAGPASGELPDYPGFQGDDGRVNAERPGAALMHPGGDGPQKTFDPIKTPPGNGGGPGSSPETAIDLTTVDPRELMELLADGGWIRQGDGEPYQVRAGETRLAYPQEGDTEVAPGVFTRNATPEEVIEARRNDTGLGRRMSVVDRGMADVISLGFADELGAWRDTVFGTNGGEAGPLSRGGRRNMWTGGGFDQAYRHNLAIERGSDEVDTEQMPILRGASQVGGGVLGAAVTGGASAARNGAPVIGNGVRGMFGQMRRSALAGGAYGTAYGFGSGEGNAVERAPSALTGGVTGAAVGGAAPPVTALLRHTVVRPTVNALQSGARFTGRQFVRALGDNAPAWLASRVQPNALQSGADLLAERMGQTRVSALAPRVTEQRSLGLQPTLVDSLDDGTVGTMRSLATRNTPAREEAVSFAERRGANLPSRTRRIAEEEISPDQRPTPQVVEDLRASRRANTSNIENFGDDVVKTTPELIAALRADIVRPHIRSAANRAQAGVTADDAAAANRLNGLAETLADNPNGARITVREAQDVSRALNEAAEAAYRSGSPDGPVLSRLAANIRDSARNSSGGYRRWLEQYGDDSDLIEAATTGRNFVSVSHDPASARSTAAFVESARNAAPPVREVQRQAAGQAVNAAASNPKGARRVLDAFASDADMNARASALDIDASRLADRARGEINALTRAQRISPRVGSETSTNVQDTANAAGSFLEAVMNPVRATGRFAVNAVLLRRGFTDNEAEAIVRAAIDPDQTDAVIAMLSQRMSRSEARLMVTAIRDQTTRVRQDTRAQ